VDGITTSIDDEAQVESDARHAHRLGFGGKLCIHPNQLAATNRAFLPSNEEITWAQRVLSSAAEAQGAAFSVDGKMIDKPVILIAQRIVEEAKRKNIL
jgi:citrate lyase subunit beta/citryl-CoA lyase